MSETRLSVMRIASTILGFAAACSVSLCASVMASASSVDPPSDDQFDKAVLLLQQVNVWVQIV